MHIALINAFPNLPSTAEVEFIKRFSIAADRLGHKAYEVVTSDDIHDCAPDFVIATHEFSPKLTPFLTFGALWSPPAFYAADAERHRSILSYDGYLVGSPKVAQFLDDLEFSTGIGKPRSDFRFLPTAPAAPFAPRPADRPYELVYVGVHWDGGRHGNLLDLLSKRGCVSFYGPPANWRAYPDSYRGEVPYDGMSMHRTLARHGIALCLHKQEHRAADTPSMRLFEAAAAGCLIVTDGIPFAKEVLGDAAFHLDLKNAAAEQVSGAIADIVDWANRNRDLADDMARRSHERLNGAYSLERTVEQCCAFATATREAIDRRAAAGAKAAIPAAAAASGPMVDVIIRTGGRQIEQLRRAIRSVADQRFGTFRVILADYRGRPDIAALATTEATATMAIDYLRCENNGFRSSTLWSGLRAVKAPFFAMLDDDDELMPEHFGHLLATAADRPGHPLYYSGVVRVEEERIEFITQHHFAGPLDLTIPERRELKFMDGFDLVRLLNFDNYIQSNAWIARSDCLDERLLVDPKLVVCEDMYLYFMLARHGSFVMSPSPTAYWNWRSVSTDNSMSAVERDIWRSEGQRVLLRLDQEVMREGIRFGPARTLSTLIPRRLPPHISDRARLKHGETQLFAEVVRNTTAASIHPPETDGVWTSETLATIKLRAERQLTAFDIRLALTVAGRRGTPQHLTLWIGSRCIFDGEVRTWRALDIAASVSLERASADFVLTAKCSYTISPREEGIGDDPRQLGILFSTIELRDPPEAERVVATSIVDPSGHDEALRKTA